MSITTITAQMEHTADADVCYRVIATTDSQMLPQLRDALKAFQPTSVVVSAAVSWGDGGTERCYRGQRYTADREVTRVEITCAENSVEAIVNAVERVLMPARAQGNANAVVAFPLGFARGGMSVSAA